MSKPSAPLSILSFHIAPEVPPRIPAYSAPIPIVDFRFFMFDNERKKGGQLRHHNKDAFAPCAEGAKSGIASIGHIRNEEWKKNR
jgi:hypothetical protein